MQVRVGMEIMNTVWWVSVLLSSLFSPSLCFNHWVVTEDGKIEHQVRTGRGLRAFVTRGVAPLSCTYV